MFGLRRGLGLIIVVNLFLSCASSETAGVAPKPKLILVLSIDQMRFDYLTRFADLYKGGFRTLLQQGAVFSNARYRHANTETGPGHSVILSGRHASHSGIVANSWYDPFLRKNINVVEDPVHRPIGGKGRGVSPANFIGFTVGDVLKVQFPEARVVGVALKDRSAILMGGRRADAAYWYENVEGRFISSSYYMKTAPAWLDQFNKLRFPDQYAGKKWTRLMEDKSIYEKYAGKDDVEGEWDRKDTVFPHLVRGNPPEPRFYDEFRRMPFADDMTLQVALEAMKGHEIGRDNITDILAIGFAATDVIGHTYGADSQEVMDQLLRLDLTLEKLFQEVESRVGMANTWVVLTADHGSLPLVENLQAKGLPAKRVKTSDIVRIVQEVMNSKFPGVQGLIASFDPPNFYLDEEVIRRNKIKREAVEEAITSALMATGDFESVYTRAQILDANTPDLGNLSLIRNSFFLPRSPHLTVTPKKYVYLSDAVGGTGHGTPHDYDRHVPIVFMAPWVKPGRYTDPCGPEDIAPTLADRLGLEFPRESDSRILVEMMKELKALTTGQ